MNKKNFWLNRKIFKSFRSGGISSAKFDYYVTQHYRRKDTNMR